MKPIQQAHKGRNAAMAGFVVAAAAFQWTLDVQAVDDSWTSAGDGYWTNAANWSLGVPNNTFVTTFITNGATKTVTLDAASTISNLTIGAPLGTMNTLELIAGSSLQASSNTAVGRGPGFAQLTSEAGSVFTGLVVTVGSAGTTLGPGRWTINGGTNVVNGPAGGTALFVGNSSFAGSTGSVVMAGGLLQVNAFAFVAARQGGSASLSVEGGSLKGNLLGIGTVNLSAGSFNLSGGTVDLTELRIAGNASSSGSSTGIVVVSGGTLSVTNGAASSRRINLGRGAGYGELTISNGLVLTIGEFVGAGASAGEPGNGKLTIVGGTNKLFNISNSPQRLDIGVINGSTGVVVVAGTGLLDAGLVPVWVGNGGVGSLTVSNNGTLLASTLVVGSNTTGQGTVTMAGGTLIVTNGAQNARLVVGARGSGTLTLNGGKTTADNLVVSNGASSVFTFNAGELNTRSTTVSNGSLITVGNGIGAATWNLIGGTHSFADDLTINSNALLKGNGTVVGNTTVFGTLSPGQSPGLINFVGDLTLAPGATNVVELNGLTPGLGFDHLNVQGGVELTDSILDLSLGFSPTPGDQFIIISNDLADAVIGTFAGLAEGSSIFVGTINEFQISYEGGTGNDVMLTFLVPEPSSFVLIALGAAIAGVARRKVRR